MLTQTDTQSVFLLFLPPPPYTPGRQGYVLIIQRKNICKRGAAGWEVGETFSLFLLLAAEKWEMAEFGSWEWDDGVCSLYAWEIKTLENGLTKGPSCSEAESAYCKRCILLAVNVASASWSHSSQSNRHSWMHWPPKGAMIWWCNTIIKCHR